MLGGTANIRAEDLYLSARALLMEVNRGGSNPPASITSCLAQIQGAIKQDKKFALAWVLKSNAHDAAQIYFPLAVDAHRKAARKAAAKAYSLQPKLPQAHLELAFKALGQRDWTKAEKEFAKACALGLSADEIGQYAYLLINVGHIKRAHDLFLLSHASDRLNASLFMSLIGTSDILGDTDAALRFYDRGRALFPTWPAGDFNTLVVLWGRRRDAARAKRIARKIPGPVFAAVYSKYGSPKAVLKALRKNYANPSWAGPINRMAIAACAAHFGDQKLALQALVEASEAVPLYTHKFWQPLFSKVRKLPGFKTFERRQGLAAYWKRYGLPDPLP
jgi:hypothetical protein